MKYKITKKSIIFWILIIITVVLIHILLINKLFINDLSNKTSKKNTNTQKIEEVNNSPICSRNTPYKTNPEFERGISLLYQRIEENKDNSTVPEELKSTINQLLQIRNCINVQYDETSNGKDINKETEGFFVFNPESSVENLQIYVNKKYSNYDDALTALLLVHEVTHATQFVDFKINKKNISCVDKEIEAVRMEFRLLRSFKYAENTSIKARILYEEEQGSDLGASFVNKRMKIFGLEGVSQLLAIQDKLLDLCENENNKKSEDNKINIFECAGKKETEYIRDYILDNPFYQEQCKTE